MHKRMKTELAADALKMARIRRKIRTPVLLHFKVDSAKDANAITRNEKKEEKFN